MRADTAVLILEMFKTIKEDVKGTDLPFCFINVSKEDRVDNAKTDEIAAIAQHEACESHMIEGADHGNIVFDETYLRPFLHKTLAFLDKVL